MSLYNYLEVKPTNILGFLNFEVSSGHVCVGAFLYEHDAILFKKYAESQGRHIFCYDCGHKLPRHKRECETFWNSVERKEIPMDAKQLDELLSAPAPNGDFVILTGALEKRVAYIIATYKGGSVDDNLALARYIINYIKRHLSK